MRDVDGLTGATAGVVVPAFWDAHQEPGDWRMMAAAGAVAEDHRHLPSPSRPAVPGDPLPLPGRERG